MAEHTAHSTLQQQEQLGKSEKQTRNKERKFPSIFFIFLILYVFPMLMLLGVGGRGLYILDLALYGSASFHSTTTPTPIVISTPFSFPLSDCIWLDRHMPCHAMRPTPYYVHIYPN